MGDFSLNSPRRMLSLSKERTTRSASDSDERVSGFAVSEERGAKPSEVYGFVGSISTVVMTAIFLLWAYIPEPWLHFLGINYYPSRYMYQEGDHLDNNRNLQHVPLSCHELRNVLLKIKVGNTEDSLEEYKQAWEVTSHIIMFCNWTDGKKLLVRAFGRYYFPDDRTSESHPNIVEDRIFHQPWMIYWALAVPAYGIVTIASILIFYVGLNFMMTPPPTSLNTIFDEHTREHLTPVVSDPGSEQPIEPISDIPINQINTLMFG